MTTTFITEHRLKNIKMLILDIDGVLTDGRIYLLPDGNEVKVFNTLDGHGIKMLQRAGVEVAVISGRSSPAAEHRMQQLGVQHYYSGVTNKIAAFKELLKKTHITAEECADVGDDLPDLPIMNEVGFCAAPPNACEAVLHSAHFITRKGGGEGAVREICDFIIAAQNMDTEPFLA
ncbi:MAG: HAD-IIIA family hydrolase [Neisseriaceae bacterium]|nr:HAD-IIIA family hydrolase [Neisseriaceae bacterium]